MTRATLALHLCMAAIVFAACSPARPSASVTAPNVDSAQSEWERTLAAARQEGKVAVIIPSGNEVRDALVQPFEAK